MANNREKKPYFGLTGTWLVIWITVSVPSNGHFPNTASLLLNRALCTGCLCN